MTKDELVAKVMGVCIMCQYGKWVSGAITCGRKRTRCHSKRVLKWVAEIERLDGGERSEG